MTDAIAHLPHPSSSPLSIFGSDANGDWAYALLCDSLTISAPPLSCPARIQSVTRLEHIGSVLAVPATIAPPAEDLLGHLLFALKHEGINLCILAQALPQIPSEAFEAALKLAPNGSYLRKACFLHESFTGEQISQSAPIRGAFIPLFDPERYITRQGLRNSRWRVEFNGLGSLSYCATVERTFQLNALLESDILGRTRTFLETLPSMMMDRAMGWAYLHETRESFAIERESPSEDKAQRFVQLLRQAHECQALSEDYLVALQNATVANPFDQAAAFRHEQNYLANGLSGAAGVTYLPPPPELCRELMEELICFANEAPKQINPLVAAGIISFGFVFLHPFMDGNGCLSRFLVHQALCQSGALPNGLLLPVSVAMKQEEQRYLETLQKFSKPIRSFWDVCWIDFNNQSFEFKGHSALYRFWDANPGVTFLVEMAKRALDIELREETLFLERFDHIFKTVNDRFDLRGSDLSQLIIMCLTQNGTVSKNRRKQFQYKVPEPVFDYLEFLAQEALQEKNQGK